MITNLNPFLRNDYYPDQNDIDTLNTRINEVQSDVDLLAITVNEKTEAVNGRLNNFQDDYNESFETEALSANIADINVLNVNVQATIKDLNAINTYTENLIVNKPVQDLALKTPHLENTTSLNGNFYNPNLINPTFENVNSLNLSYLNVDNLAVNWGVSDLTLYNPNIVNANVISSNFSNATLVNPTFENIKGTEEKTTTALVIDRGKLISKKISNEVEGEVASSLVAKKEVRTSTLLDEWKPNSGNTLHKIPVSSTAQFVMNATNGEVLLTNENGNQIVVSELGVNIREATGSIVHRNFVYIIHPTVENESTFKCVIIPINTNTMEVSPSFDITQYFGEVSRSDFEEDPFDVVMNKATFCAAMLGMVLSEDVPTIGFIGTSTYINLSTMEVKTRATVFGNKWCVLSKNGNWIELSGSALNGEDFYCTNGKYSSVEDTALGVPACENIIDSETNIASKQLFYVDAPLFGFNSNSLIYSDGGEIKEVAFSDIPGYPTYESLCENMLGTVDKDGNPIYFSPASIVSGSFYSTSLYLVGGYYPREYFNTSSSCVETIRIDDTKVEVNGSTFYGGVWYDKVVSSVSALIDFITKQKANKRYKVLFLGNNVEFDSSDPSQFPLPIEGYPSDDIYGTFDIYHLEDDRRTFTLKLTGTPGTATRVSKLIDACHWHGFYTHVSLLFCYDALFNTTSGTGYLHINDCYLQFNTVNAVPKSTYYLGISDSNNVIYRTVDIPANLFSDNENKNVDLTLSKCYNVIFNDNNSSSNLFYGYSNLLFDCCDRCEANIYNTISNVLEQSGPGYNFTYNEANPTENKVETPKFVYKVIEL